MVKIQEMMVAEMCQSWEQISNEKIGYYNEVTGDLSFILSKLLELELDGSDYGWEEEKWFDDSLLSKIKVAQNTVSIWGVMIWGRKGTTEQWVTPFYLKVELNKSNSDFLNYVFLFSYDRMNEITYSRFKENRGLFDVDFYSSNMWDPSERDWEYFLATRNESIVY